MIRARRYRGFSILELIVALPILVLLFLLAFSILNTLGCSGQRAAKGASELGLAIKITDHFRADVRAAEKVATSPDGRSVTMTSAQIPIRYKIDAAGRLIREIDGRSDGIGPQVTSAVFELEEFEGRTAIVKARIVCAGEALPLSSLEHPEAEAGYLLTLDMALRQSGAIDR